MSICTHMKCPLYGLNGHLSLSHLNSCQAPWPLRAFLPYQMPFSLFCSFSRQICSPSTLPQLHTLIPISLMWSHDKSSKSRKGNGTEKRREGAILKNPSTHTPAQITAPGGHSLLQSPQHTHNLLAPFLKDVGGRGRASLIL